MGGLSIASSSHSQKSADPPYGGWDSVSGSWLVVERKQSFGGGRS
jgi:hypothetical protein